MSQEEAIGLFVAIIFLLPYLLLMCGGGDNL